MEISNLLIENPVLAAKEESRVREIKRETNRQPDKRQETDIQITQRKKEKIIYF